MKMDYLSHLNKRALKNEIAQARDGKNFYQPLQKQREILTACGLDADTVPGLQNFPYSIIF